MSKDLLSKRLDSLYDMELNNYLMARCINKLNSDINSLGISKKNAEPVKDEEKTEILPTVVTVTVICGIIGIITGFIVGVCRKDSGLFIKCTSGLSDAIVYCFWSILIGIFIGLAICAISKSKHEKRAEEQYKADLTKYKKALDNDSLRVKRELKKRDALIRQRDAMRRRYEEASDLLDKFYDATGIDKNYRNIVPISYMAEFMRLGIATKLEGADGLYYLVRQELRSDQLQYTLEEISYKLDIIIDRQHNLYAGLVEINSKCDLMVKNSIRSIEIACENNKQLKQIGQNTALTAYNTERARKELLYYSLFIN